MPSEVAEAYIREYGHAPTSDRERDLYGAFRFGFQAGQKSGAREERQRIESALRGGNDEQS